MNIQFTHCYTYTHKDNSIYDVDSQSQCHDVASLQCRIENLLYLFCVLCVADSEVFRMHRMETRCHCLGAGQSQDACRSQWISSAGRGRV